MLTPPGLHGSASTAAAIQALGVHRLPDPQLGGLLAGPLAGHELCIQRPSAAPEEALIHRGSSGAARAQRADAAPMGVFGFPLGEGTPGAGRPRHTGSIQRWEHSHRAA